MLSYRSDVDFVLTFEELQGMFEAKGVDFSAIPEGESMREGTAAGRGWSPRGAACLALISYPSVQIPAAAAVGTFQRTALVGLVLVAA